MVRSLSTDAASAKDSQYGSEPVCILGVRWGGGAEIKYAERSTSFAKGSIQSFGSLSETIQVDSNATSTSIEVTLSDTEGDLKSIIDTTDIHKNKCTLYQWFDGLPETDSFILFTGEINSPIVWNESERTLSFTIISKIESREVGFSPEEGQFSNVSPNLIGKVWPLAFGEVLHVPAVKSVEKTRGSTQTLIGIPDYTLPYKYWHLRNRLDILRDGFLYYKSAIYYLLDTLPLLSSGQSAIQGILRNPNLSDEAAINYIFQYVIATAQALEDEYVEAILVEDRQKQEFENLGIFITNQGKVYDDLKSLVTEDDSGATEADNLEAAQVESLQDRAEFVFSVFEAMVNSSSVLNDNSKQTIISLVDNTFRNSAKTIKTAIQAGDFKTAVNAIVQEYLAMLNASKVTSEKTDESLTLLAGKKDIIHTEIENAESVFQDIRSVLHKINKVYINIFKTQREIYKISAVIQQHNAIPKFEVVVTDGDKFPQNTPVLISINDMTYYGTFNGKTFTAKSVQPRYTNIPVVLSSRVIDSFDIADSSIDLRGHYCLVSVSIPSNSPDYDPTNPYGYRIFQITNQVGTRCTMQLIEINPTINKPLNPNRLPLLTDLPNYLWGALDSATEHTVEEKKRILEEAIPKYDSERLAKIRSNLEILNEELVTANEDGDDETYRSLLDTVYKNIREYNTKATNAKYKREAIEKVNSKISSEEHQNLLKLQNLKYRLSDQDDEDYEIIKTNRFYYITGYEVFHILATSPTMLPSWFQFSPQGQEIEQDSTVISLPNGSRIKANILPDSGLWYADVGAVVELVNSQEEKYICNILPSEIKSVYAYRNLNGVRQFVPVPSRYYTKNENDNYGGLNCTSITLKRRLEDYPNEGWEGTLYVSMISSVGPNTVDIIEWIAENYTDLTVDSTSFNTVRSLLQNYPSSFALFEKKDALSLIREIAWQARCSVWVVNDVLYIKYLSATPTSITTFTESDILEDSLKIEHTETEDLVTKLTANWQPDYSKDEPNKLVLRHNVNKYGTIEEEYDFYIYNIEDLVNKSATFWLIRKANTWKLATFSTPLSKLQLQSFDGVTLDVTPNYFANSSVLGVIREASYSIKDNTVDFTVWLPIRLGEMTPYDFAFPSSVEVDKIYPSQSEISEGAAGSPGSNVPTSIGFNINPNTNLVEYLSFRPKDYGRPFMSDEYDSYPISAISLLREEDYIPVSPEKYKLPVEDAVTDKYSRPDYTSNSSTLEKDEKSSQVFLGRVTSVVDGVYGIYKVESSDKKEYEVRQFGGGKKGFEEGDAVTVIRDPKTGQLLTNSNPTEAGTTISNFKIIEEKDNYLLCKAYNLEADSVENDTLVPIAKPRLFRKKPFDGKTIEYPDKSIKYTYDPDVVGLRVAETTITVTNPGSSTYSLNVKEAQRIVPAYFEGDIISALKAPTGMKTEPETDDEDPRPIQWTDLNTGGRAWAHSPSNDPTDNDGD